MKKALTQADLNKMQCGAPGCTHASHDGTLVLAGRCHPGRGTEATYDQKDGSLTIRCNVCKALVCVIGVHH